MSEKKNTTQAAADTAAVKAAKDAAEAMAYMGPDIKNVAINGTVYTGGLPTGLQEKIKEIPAIKGLIIPISGLAAANVAISTQGTALNTLYKTVSERTKNQ